MPARFDDPRLYTREVLKLAGRRQRDSWSAKLELSAPLLVPQAPELGVRLSREVAAGHYTFRPLEPRPAVLNGKPRTIYRLDPLDAVVWGVLTHVLMTAMEPRLGAYLSSYRKGRSQWTACRGFLAYLRAHVRARPDPRTRGLFVLRRDVRRYDETIPTGPDSALWSTLRELCGPADLGFRGDLGAFVQAAFRPPIVQPDGSARPLERGVATGLPTQTIACNTYLVPLDRELCALEGGFYARFGDDVLFAHPERSVAEQARQLLERGVTRLQLSFNPAKSDHFWLTGPGRAAGELGEFVPTARISYLGFDVGFAGALLRADKRRALWLALEKRLDHTGRLLEGATRDERANALCSVMRAAFDPRSPLAERYAPWLRFDVMARDDLRQLDYLIALRIAEQLSGVRGVRAFRDCPPRELQERFGLVSLLHTWDDARRRGRRTS
jgi:hypothetical protein